MLYVLTAIFTHTLTTTRDTGNRGEDLATEYIQAQGYAMLARNYRAGKYEIDIIAQKDKTLIIIEVKTRHTSQHGFPDEAVNKNKLEQLSRAAAAYMEANNYSGDLRFDIISVTLGTDTPRIEHFTDVYIPYDL